MLTAKNISYWYKQQDDYLFKDVNLSFDSGKTYAILGSSGSGKTTFLSLLSGMDKPKGGQIVWDDQDIAKLGLTRYRRTGVSIVFQAYNLLPYMTALQNVTTAMSITHAKQSDAKNYALTMLKSVGIDDVLAKKNVTKLSGGQQQRVAIVRAMCCDAPIIVADEPTGNLDQATSKEIITILQTIARQQNKTVIIVTHELEVAHQCDFVFELTDKKFQTIIS